MLLTRKPPSILRKAVANYGFGPDKAVDNRWYFRKENILVSSEDVTNVIWSNNDATKDDATHITFTAQNGVVHQAVTTLSGVSYTISFKARRITGNTNLYIRHIDSATGNETAQAITATLTRYSLTVLGKSSSGTVYFGIQDRNASGHGQIEITEWQVVLGSSEGIYETTTDEQTLSDFTKNANDGEKGGTGAEDTGDSTLQPFSINRMAPGSTEDLTDSDWDTTDVTVDDTTTCTFDAQNGILSQAIPTLEDYTYTLSFDIRRISGNTALHFYHNSSATGNSTALTVTAALTRRFITIAGKTDDGYIDFGIRDEQASGQGQIEITNLQVNLGGIEDYVSPDEPQINGWSYDGIDDLATIDAVIAEFTGEDKPFTLISIAKPTDVLGNKTLISFGAAANATHYLNFHLQAAKLRLGIKDGTNLKTITSSANHAAALIWKVLTATSTGKAGLFYVDGELVAANNSDLDVGTITLDQAAIGMLRRSALSLPFDGDFAHAALFDRVLSYGDQKVLYKKEYKKFLRELLISKVLFKAYKTAYGDDLDNWLEALRLICGYWIQKNDDIDNWGDAQKYLYGYWEIEDDALTLSDAVALIYRYRTIKTDTLSLSVAIAERLGYLPDGFTDDLDNWNDDIVKTFIYRTIKTDALTLSGAIKLQYNTYLPKVDTLALSGAITCLRYNTHLPKADALSLSDAFAKNLAEV